MVTSHIHNCLVDLSTSASEYDEVEHKVEDASRASAALDIDQRAQRQFTSMLLCCKKVIFIICFGDVFQVAIVLKMGVYVVVQFMLGSRFLFLCSFFMLIYDNEYETKIKFEPRIKLNHNIYISICMLWFNFILGSIFIFL